MESMVQVSGEVSNVSVCFGKALLYNGRQPESTASSSGVLACHHYGNMFLDGCVVSLRWLSCRASNFRGVGCFALTNVAHPQI